MQGSDYYGIEGIKMLKAKLASAQKICQGNFKDELAKLEIEKISIKSREIKSLQSIIKRHIRKRFRKFVS